MRDSYYSTIQCFTRLYECNWFEIRTFVKHGLFPFDHAVVSIASLEQSEDRNKRPFLRRYIHLERLFAAWFTSYWWRKKGANSWIGSIGRNVRLLELLSHLFLFEMPSWTIQIEDAGGWKRYDCRCGCSFGVQGVVPEPAPSLSE
jgi:hypothetical protein